MPDLSVEDHQSITEISKNQWNNVVSQSERGTLFNRYEWIRAVERGFDYEPRHIVIKKNGNPIGLLPNFITDLPLPDTVTEELPFTQPLKQVSSNPTGFGGPIIVSNENESLDLLFDSLEESVGRDVVTHTVKTYDLDYVRYGQYMENRGYEATFNSCLFFINLQTGWESILDNMHKDRRRAIRKGHEQDYRIDVIPFDDDLETTYEYYVKNIDRVGGTVFPKAFFESLAELFDDRLRVFRIVVDDEEIGRYVYLLDDEGATLHNWLSAIPDSSYYQYHPAELLHERAIKWGIDQGYRDYSFGKTGSHFDNTVFRFKEKYGGSVVPLFQMEKGFSRFVWPLYKLGRSRYVKQSL